jgi:hypothetical protein
VIGLSKNVVRIFSQTYSARDVTVLVLKGGLSFSSLSRFHALSTTSSRCSL